MSDAFEIQQVISLYSHASSRKDYATVLTTFVEDGRWELPDFDLKFQGREQLLQVMPTFLAPYSCYQQLNSPALIQITGKTATAQSIVREYSQFRDRNVANEILGFYNDELIHTADGWKFSRRVYILDGGCSRTVDPIDFALPANA